MISNGVKKIVGIIAVLAVFSVVIFVTRQKQDSGSMEKVEQMEKSEEMPDIQAIEFGNPKKSAHYETNTPAHGAILAAAPVNIVIDFNFDLAEPSSISVTRDGKEYGVGETKIARHKLSMRRDFDQNAPDGLYKVSYKACWPDGSCHDGSFEFAIDRSLKNSYQNLKGKKEVTVNLAEISFQSKNILISPGTKITWKNMDEVEHYVNTDSHPAHSYYPMQNSGALKKGDAYAVTFDKPGIYPYHCSAHAASMTGSIIVE